MGSCLKTRSGYVEIHVQKVEHSGISGYAEVESWSQNKMNGKKLKKHIISQEAQNRHF